MGEGKKKLKKKIERGNEVEVEEEEEEGNKEREKIEKGIKRLKALITQVDSRLLHR